VLEPTRPRVIKWYCPFASQDGFPTGHRYCINVFTGCAHACVYCYVAAYQAGEARIKQDLELLVDKDMEDLERFDVPPAPVHLSNSTDAFQPLEREHGHTRYALERILDHRHRFTSVVMLTKNPLLPVQQGYVDLFRKLGRLPKDHPKHDELDRQERPGFLMEVSLAFWQESSRTVYDPGAPAIEKRIEGIHALHEAGIPVVLRIDPLFPCSLTDVGVPEAQTLDDLENLVALAKEIDAPHVVYSAAKIVLPRGRKLLPVMQSMSDAYRALAAPETLPYRGKSWRLPDSIAKKHVIGPFLEICKRHGIPAKHCKQNLVETP